VLDSDYKTILKSAPFGYAYHEIICDPAGTPRDYRFLEVNNAFERLTGLNATDIIGRTVREVIPGIEKSAFDWIGFYGKVALEGGTETFEQYSEPLERWYKVQVYSPGSNFFSTVFVDVSEEKAKTAELEGFFSVNLDLLCIADLEGNFIKINKEWETALGYTIDQLQSKKFLEFVHPDDLPETLKAMAALSDQREVLNFVNRYRTSSGAYRTIEWRSRPQGSLIYAAARDITDRRAAEDETRENKVRFELAINGTNDGIWDWDLRTNALFLSKRWKAMLGYADDELKNEFSTFAGLLYEEDRERVQQYVQKYLNGEKEVYALEFRMMHKDGSPRWMLAKGEAVRDPSGKPYRMAGSHSDITVQKQAEAELAESRQRLELAMDAGEHGFWDWNLVTGETFFSPVYYTMLGYHDQELPMHIDTFVSLMHPDDVKNVMPRIQKKIAGGSPYEVEFRLLCKDGSYKWIAGKGKSYYNDGSGKPYRAVGVHIDINSRKLVEQELQAITNRLSLALRAGNIGIWEVDPETNDAVWDDQMFALFGTRRQKNGNTREVWLAAVHPDDVSRSEAQVAQAVRGEKEYDTEFRVHWPDGSDHVLRGMATVIRDDAGRALRLVGTNWDITVEREREQQALAASKAKAAAGGLTSASPGSGTSNHMALELLGYQTGVKFTHVPYKGSGPAVQDVIGGQVNMMFDTALVVGPHVQAGKLRPIAVTSSKRLESLPDVPTIAEAGEKGFDMGSWQAVFAPAGTPGPIVERLHAEIMKIVATPEVQARLKNFGMLPSQMTPAELGEFQKAEVVKWGKVIKAAGIKAE